MKILSWCLLGWTLLMPGMARAVDLFNVDEPVQDGLHVFDMSQTFAEIYQKLDAARWAGKSLDVAIESLENMHDKAHIAATDQRVVLVWDDAIVANFPRPAARDWDEYGQITTALLLKMRQYDPGIRQMTESGLYRMATEALLRGIDENGRYIYSLAAQRAEDPRMLTSVGIQGARDARGNYRVTGVFKDSPADVAGMVAGDLISQINGAAVRDLTDADLAAALSGFDAGTIKVTLLTPSGTRTAALRRASVVLTDADVMYRRAGDADSPNILEIVVHKISDNAVAIVNEALARYTDTDGIILDLRSAAGDDERAAAKLAGLFVGAVPVMRVVETAMAEVEVIPGAPAVTAAPMVVLVSNMTRSTAEAVAAAIYENHRGLLVGTPTAGTARVATQIELTGGGALELLNKSIKTGTGRPIEGRGIFPLVCLSNIRTDSQRDAFFLNVINNNFRAQDFNKSDDYGADDIRRGCPSIASGADEDVLSTAVAVKILTDPRLYQKLLNE
ncbi:PDZ domain-containing protein [bacterium]|nr:PDZ domain-containing protein [bacterium]